MCPFCSQLQAASKTPEEEGAGASKTMDQILEQCFADMGVDMHDVINFATFSDAMQLHSDRTGKKHTKQQLKTMFDEADWYGTGEIEISELIEVCWAIYMRIELTPGIAYPRRQLIDPFR